MVGMGQEWVLGKWIKDRHGDRLGLRVDLGMN